MISTRHPYRRDHETWRLESGKTQEYDAESSDEKSENHFLTGDLQQPSRVPPPSKILCQPPLKQRVVSGEGRSFSLKPWTVPCLTEGTASQN